jgi:hypothetical protein
VVALTVIGLLVTALAAALSLLAGVALGIALAACPLVAAALVWSAAIPGQRGRLGPDQLMTASLLGEVGGPIYLLRWAATGPLLALVVLLPPALILQGAADGSPSRTQATVTNAFVFLVVALAIEVAWLRSRRPPA